MSLFSPCFVTRWLKYPVFRPPRALQDKKLAYFIPMPFTGCGTMNVLGIQFVFFCLEYHF
jgi:hypothetical protein